MARKKPQAIFAYVVERDGSRLYSQFFPESELPRMIEQAETIYTGVTEIEKAHAGEAPVWVRANA
jgi:hypothetical protein